MRVRLHGRAILRTSSGLLLTGALLALSAGAHASNDSAERDAQARFEEGLARVKGGDFEGARLSFVEAYAVLRRPRILWNLALSEEKTGRLLEALDHFRQVAADSQADDADRADAGTHVTSLTSQTARIDVRAPAGALIAIDGNPTAEAAPLPVPVDVLPGHHLVDAKVGDRAASLSIDAVAGTAVRADFSAMGAQASRPLASATPPAPPAIPAPEPPREAAVSSPGTGKVVAVAVLGVAAVAGIVTGGVLAEQSQNKENAAGRDRSSLGVATCPGLAGCAQLSDDVSAQRTDAIWATGLYVAGGLLGAAAVVTWFAWPSPKGAALTPEIEPRRVGLRLGLTF